MVEEYDHGCTAPQVRVAYRRSSGTLTSATMGWASRNRYDHHAPPPVGKCVLTLPEARQQAVRIGTDYGCVGRLLVASQTSRTDETGVCPSLHFAVWFTIPLQTLGATRRRGIERS